MGSDGSGRGGRAVEKLRALHTIPSSLAFSPAGPLPDAAAARASARPGHVALTFDDGPDPVGTPPILGGAGPARVARDLLRARRHGATAARASSAELVAAGHDVGVHASTHRSHRHMTPAQIRDDVRARARRPSSTPAAVPEFYRPPHGAVSPEGLLTARRLGMRTVLWTTWGRDWRAEATPESVRGRRRRRAPRRRHRAPARLRLHVGAGQLAHHARRRCRASPICFAARDLTVGPLRDHFGAVRPAVAA